jgi:hypothetical protein
VATTVTWQCAKKGIASPSVRATIAVQMDVEATVEAVTVARVVTVVPAVSTLVMGRIAATMGVGASAASVERETLVLAEAA